MSSGHAAMLVRCMSFSSPRASSPLLAWPPSHLVLLVSFHILSGPIHKPGLGLGSSFLRPQCYRIIQSSCVDFLFLFPAGYTHSCRNSRSSRVWGLGLYNTRPPGFTQVPGCTDQCPYAMHMKSRSPPERLLGVILTPHRVLKHLSIIPEHGAH